MVSESFGAPSDGDVADAEAAWTDVLRTKGFFEVADVHFRTRRTAFAPPATSDIDTKPVILCSC